MLNEEVLTLLIENNYKITKFRRYLVDILCEYEHTLLSAKMLKEILVDVYEYNASFDTIYKNLVIFTNLNITSEKIINHESFYILTATLEAHHHFICLNCAEVFEIEDYCSDEFYQEKLGDFEVTGHNLEVYGYCSECKKLKSIDN